MNKGPLRQLTEQTMVYGLGTIVPRFLNYAILTPFYTRVLDLSEYGTVTELYAYMAVLLVVLTYGMETAYFRFASHDKHPTRVFSSTVTMIGTTSLLFIILVTIFLRNVADVLEYRSHPEYILYFALIVALDAFSSIPFAKLRLENKSLKFGIIKLINVFIIIIVVYVFLYLIPRLGKTSDSILIQRINKANIGVGYVFIANLLGSLVSMICLLGEFKGFTFRIDLKLLKVMFNYALPLLIAGLFGILNESFDKIVFKRLVVDKSEGLALLGVYSANYKIAVLMTLFIQMFRYAVEPFFFKESKGKNPQGLYARVMFYFILFGIIIYLGIIINIKVVIVLIAKDFRGGMDIVPIVLAANMMYGIFINLSVWYKINDMTWYAAFINGMGVLVTILVNVLFIPVYGYHASAWGHVLAYTVMIIMSYFIGRRIYKIPYNLSKIFVYLLIGAIAYIIIRYFNYLGNLFYLITFNTLLIIGIYIIYKKEIAGNG